MSALLPKPPEPADFIAGLCDDEVTFFLAQDPLGASFLETNTDAGERRWFLYDLFLARPLWFARSIAHIAAVRRSQSAQLALL